MFENHPDMARRWAAETPNMSDLPEHVSHKDPPMKKQKSDPRMDALSELHSMLTQSIGAKLKAKKSPAQEIDPEEAQESDQQLGQSGEPDENPGLKAKKKMHFGPGHKK